MSERALGEPTPTPEEGEVRDLTLEEWMDGVRPFRLSVDLVTVNDPDGSAAARLEQISTELDELPDGPQADALVDEAIALQESVVRRRTFVVEQRSLERVNATRKNAMEAVGVKVGEEWTDAQVEDVTLRLLHDQIVAPESFSLDDLKRLHAEEPDQADRLAEAMGKVNEGAAGSKGLTRDFSRRRSPSRSTRRR